MLYKIFFEKASMKEKLTNSLKLLSAEIDSLSSSFGFYRESLDRRFKEKIEAFSLREGAVKEKLENSFASEIAAAREELLSSKKELELLRGQVDVLKAQLGVEKEKNARVKDEIKLLKIDLKNKLNEL